MQEEKYYRTLDISEVIMEQLGDQIREIMKEDIIQEITEQVMQNTVSNMEQHGMTPPKIAEMLQVPIEEVQRLLYDLTEKEQTNAQQKWEKSLEHIKHRLKKVSMQSKAHKTIQIFSKNEEETRLIEALVSKMNLTYSLK